MIEQAKMTPYEEEVTGVKKKRASWGYFILGIIVSLIGYVIYDFHINHYLVTQTGRKVLVRSEYPFQAIGLAVVIIGLIILVIGIIKQVYSRL